MFDKDSTGSYTLIYEMLDSDGDGMPDYWEIAHGFNPNDLSDAEGDADRLRLRYQPEGRCRRASTGKSGVVSTKGQFCPECGVQVGQAKFCPDCGTPVKPKKLACAGCGFEPADPVKFCPECGGKMG